MAKDNEISKEQVKRIENLLFKYKKIPLMIRKLELEIEMTKHTYEGIKGKSNNEIVAGSRTNATSSSVENELLSKEHRIEQIKEEIVSLKFDKDMIEIALESLTDVERDIISDKYFNSMSYYKVGEKYYFTKEWAYYTCQRIIKEKIAQYIV
nr:MAG TPA: Protein of unknown function (DUF722) [Caudoviricetes sp.]